jgi:hypothetical protein
MKKITITLITLLFFSTALLASHASGGEITWRVDSNQNFIFKVKLYRDCNGVPGPDSLSLLSNSPSTSIVCYKVGSVDLSPTGPGCPTCGNPQNNPGAVEALIYESSPVNFGTAVPPAAGWYFYYNDCCRNTVSNLSMAGSSSFQLRSLMYPFNGMAASSVLDNSPVFLNEPTYSFSSGKSINYSHAAIDSDLDSLTFTWAEPLDGFSFPGTPYPFNAGYSYLSPLPGSNLNPNNIPATMDINSGLINFKCYNIGTFVTVTKVTSYKCGIKTAEIFREIQMSILNTSSNNAPIFGGSALVDTTVLAGDTLRMNFSVTDFDTLTGGGFQSVNLSASSLHLGPSFTQGCLIQPCGVLNIPTPYNFTLFSQVSLTFPTNCSHAGFSNGCLQHQRLFSFEFNAHDNFCPVNGIANKVINVYVTGPEIQLVGNDLVVNYPGATFQWCLNGVPIPGATGTSYTPTQNGIYTLLSSTTGGCTMISNAVNRTASGLSGQQADRMFNVYPNPMSQGGQLNILVNGLGTGDALINILDVSGRLVKQIPVQLSSNTEHLIVDASDLSKGVYSIQLTTSSASQKANVVIQ